MEMEHDRQSEKLHSVDLKYTFFNFQTRCLCRLNIKLALFGLKSGMKHIKNCVVRFGILGFECESR